MVELSTMPSPSQFHLFLRPHLGSTHLRHSRICLLVLNPMFPATSLPVPLPFRYTDNASHFSANGVVSLTPKSLSVRQCASIQRPFWQCMHRVVFTSLCITPNLPNYGCTAIMIRLLSMWHITDVLGTMMESMPSQRAA